MSEEMKNDFETILENDNKWAGNFSLMIILICFFGFGFGNSENPRINELEKKVARLEGQMSMIGGKFYE